jgi:two-component system cell cycle sensor histidine kinase/response regulator CckA
MTKSVGPQRHALALQILDDAEEAFVAVDEQLHVVYANPAAKRLLGRSPWKNFQQGDDTTIQAELRHALAERVKAELESFSTPLGKWFDVRAIPLQDVGLAIRFRDITARKQAEEAARAERQRFDDVMDQLPAYLVLLSEDYHVPFANRFFRERFGESHGKRCFEYLFHRTEPCENCQTYAVMRTGQPQRWNWTGPDGRDYDIHDFPFAGADGSRLIMEVGLDVTERKRAEAAVQSTAAYNRSLIEASLDPLVTIGSDGKIIDVNAATELATGAGRAQLIGSDFASYFTEPERAEAGYQKVLAEGQVRDYPLTIRHASGRTTDVLYNATVYRNEAGEVQGVFAAARDVTARKQAEAELVRHREHLEELVEERTSQLEEANIKLQEEIAERKQAQQRLAADLSALVRMHALSTRVLEAGNLEPLLQEITDAAVAIVNADWGILYLAEKDGLRLVANHGHGQPFLDFFARAGDRSPTVREALRQSRRIVVEDIEASPLFAGTPALAVLRKTGVNAAQSTPLLNRDGALVGVLMTQWRNAYAPNERDLRRVDLLARQAADLIEHTRGHAALRASEERNRYLAGLLERSDQPFAVGYPDGSLGYLNPAYERLTGYSREELERMDWTKALTPPEWREPERALLSELQRTGRPVRYQKEYIRKDGTRVPIELLVHLVRDEQGRPLYYYSFLTDLTERRKAEDELRRSREWLRVTLTSIGDGVIAGDSEGRITFMNPMAASLTGWTPAEALGQPMLSVLHVINEQTREPGEDLVGHVLRERRAVAMANHTALITKDGREVPIEDSAAPILDAEGNVAGVVLVFHDVTEKRRAQKALREREAQLLAAVENLEEGVVFGDLDGTLIYWNRAALRMHGFASLEECCRRLPEFVDIFELSTMNGDPLPLERWPLARILHGENLHEWEVRVRRRDSGRERIVSYGGTLIRDAKGQPFLSLVTADDVTERKAAEQAARDSEERLRQAQKMESIGVLAGGIAHDFNNLLTGILGNASLLQLEEDESDRLRTIIESGEKAASLTRQLLAYAGKGLFQIADFDISRLVRSSADLFRLSVPRNIDMLTEVPRDLPPVRGDASQIQQVVMNLVINAAESIPEGCNGMVRVSADVQELDPAAAAKTGAGIAPGRYVSIAVLDNGCGMDEKTVRKIFEPFFSTKFTGRGLGLAAVHGILRSHRGAITVESAPGRGSTFTVYLPVSASETPEPGGEPLVTAGRQALTVLIIDDEEPVRAFTASALGKLGHRVLLAGNGREALEVLSNNADVDVVLLDVVMPNMGGAETLAEIRKRRPDLAVLATSGYSRQEAIRLGIPADLPFIDKPFTAQRLAAAIGAALETRDQ